MKYFFSSKAKNRHSVRNKNAKLWFLVHCDAGRSQERGNVCGDGSVYLLYVQAVTTTDKSHVWAAQEMYHDASDMNGVTCWIECLEIRNLRAYYALMPK